MPSFFTLVLTTDEIGETAMAVSKNMWRRATAITEAGVPDTLEALRYFQTADELDVLKRMDWVRSLAAHSPRDIIREASCTAVDLVAATERAIHARPEVRRKMKAVVDAIEGESLLALSSEDRSLYNGLVRNLELPAVSKKDFEPSRTRTQSVPVEDVSSMRKWFRQETRACCSGAASLGYRSFAEQRGFGDTTLSGRAIRDVVCELLEGDDGKELMRSLSTPTADGCDRTDTVVKLDDALNGAFQVLGKIFGFEWFKASGPLEPCWD